MRVLYIKNLKLLGLLWLSSFCFSTTISSQVVEFDTVQGSLLITVKSDSIKTQLEHAKIASLVEVFMHPKDSSQFPIIGNTSYTNGIIRFTPLVKFMENWIYHVVYESKSYPVFIPEQAFTFSEVQAIFPSVDTLPANQLKFYIHFKTPMQQGVAYHHVHLVRAEKDTLFMPFVVLESELWNSDKTRLTLWLDPGRVKRNLNPNRELGAPLETGFFYQLIIDASWEDEKGHALTQDFTKDFFVKKEDRQQPNVENWTFNIPSKNTQTPLCIDFKESLDHALVHRLIKIVDEDEEVMSGRIILRQKENVFCFTPDKPWKLGDYEIRVEAALEDLAGNNLNRLFDVDLKEEVSKKQERDFYSLKFQIR